MEGWRIADPEFSQNPQKMLDEEGVAIYGGRWNSKRVPMAYLASSLSLGATELLVHLGRADVLKKYHSIIVSVFLCVYTRER